MKRLLLEIRAEEIPAGYILPALDALASNLSRKLSDARIAHGQIGMMGTPLRLAISVADVAPKQQAVTTEVVGPPERVAFDGEGKLTIAGQKFAEKVGVAADALGIKETPKGRYVCVKKKERGLATTTILKQILPDVIAATPFPKTMKWGDLDLLFARPIHSIMTLLGKQAVVYQMANLKSGRYTTGHRFMHPAKIKLDDADQYVQRLREAFVYVDIDDRSHMVRDQIAAAAKSVGGEVLPDTELVDIVTNLVEYPVAVAGKFDDAFLELPAEILITAMREHQKYFAVVDADKRLLPSFIAVNNTMAKDLNLVATGHERVLRARLSDAQFFYNSDLEVTQDDRVEKLKGVLFQAKLGTMHEKISRVKILAEYLADTITTQGISAEDTSRLKQWASRAAYLCKSDLVSHVVVEFPKLQGVMGRVYAAKAGEPEAVAAAIEEHYRPTQSGGQLPVTTTGALVSIADKMDSICGCFSVGLTPTGASDPYALRRQGVGIIQILKDKGFGFSLKALIRKSLSLFVSADEERVTEAVEAVYTFLCNRMAHLLAEEGYAKDIVAAVIRAGAEDVPDLWKRAEALQAFKSQPDFEPLAAGFKRVVNIIRRADANDLAVAHKGVKQALFQHSSEAALNDRYEQSKTTVERHIAQGDYHKALLAMAGLRDAVDAFFEDVMVMAPEDDLRCNRLALLNHIGDLFGSMADFSQITT